MNNTTNSTRGYEALVILKAAGTEQDITRQAARLEEPIKKLGGSIESSHNMGRRKLAFRINRNAEGYYYLLRFQAPTGQLDELNRFFRLNDAVVRFMILSEDELVPLPSGGAAPVLGSARVGSHSRVNY